MKSEEQPRPPSTVARKEEPKPAGASAVPPTVLKRPMWTPAMLARLAQSQPQTNWYGLWDKVWHPRNLRAAAKAVLGKRGAPGVDGQSTAQFQEQLEDQIQQLAEELRTGHYQPQAVRRVWIPKPGSHEQRPLGIPAVRDRVVQNALRNVIEPIFEHDFAEHSYGFRPGRSAHQAMARVEAALEQGHTHVVDADLKSYFDTIPHARLMARLRQRLTDGSVLRLIEAFLKAGVMETMNDWQATEEGAPQGAVISPLLANLYLDELDHQVAGRGWRMVRYADDFILLCPSAEEAQKAHRHVSGWTRQAGLSLHPQKTRLVDATQESFDFLGWTISLKEGRSRKWPRKKSVQNLRTKLRPLTKRTSGKSLSRIIAEVNPILRGWRAYFKAGVKYLGGHDGWLRKRLRAILRKREKRPGQGRTPADHKRWSNHWFEEHGLYSLVHGPREVGPVSQ